MIIAPYILSMKDQVEPATPGDYPLSKKRDTRTKYQNG